MADLNSTIIRGNLRVTEDINANGSIIGSSITGNGSGLTNLNASNIGSGTLSVDRLADSGVTATSYGPNTNATPGYSGTFNVPYITVDNKGRVTAASTKTITIPASDNTWRPLGTGANDAAAGDHAHSSIRDIGNNTTTTFAYSKAGLNYDDYTWLAGWNNYELRAVNKSQFARASHSHTISDTTNLQATLDGKVNSSDLVALTLTNNSTKRYLIGSTSATTWSGVGTNSSCYTSSGNLYATYFYGTSDRRLKENIKDLDLNCLDLVNNINLREFSWKADETHKPVIGAIAQELNQVLPEKYRHEFIGGQETKDEYLSINDSKLVYLLIGAIQEQQKEIESLKAKIDGKIV